jgi:MSHA pilin protein MshC
MAKRWQRERTAGFTVTEMVTVLVLVAILSTFALPRFFDTAVFTARGYIEALVAAVAYGQKLALASGCHVGISITATGYTVGQWAICKPASGSHSMPPTVSSIPIPGGGTLTDPTPANVTVTGSASFYFDGLGRPLNTATDALYPQTTITVGANTLTIEDETGYAHVSSPTSSSL